MPDTGEIRVGDVFDTIEIHDYFHKTAKLYHNVELTHMDKITFFGEKLCSYEFMPLNNDHGLYKIVGEVREFKK